MSIFGKKSREIYLEDRVHELEILLQATIQALRNEGFPDAAQYVENEFKNIK